MSDLLARTRTLELTVWALPLVPAGSRQQHESAPLCGMRVGGVASVSSNRVLGDPLGVSAQEGCGCCGAWLPMSSPGCWRGCRAVPAGLRDERPQVAA
jgi:hypothetical protein